MSNELTSSFLWECTFYRTRYEEAICVLLRERSRDAQNMRLRPMAPVGTGSLSLHHEVTGWKLGRRDSSV